MVDVFTIFWSLLICTDTASSYLWYTTVNGHSQVKIIDKEQMYSTAEAFCLSQGADSLLPSNSTSGIVNKLNDQLEFWVKDKIYGGMCTIIRYEQTTMNWVPDRRDCKLRRPFLCEKALPVTSTLTSATSTMSASPSPSFTTFSSPVTVSVSTMSLTSASTSTLSTSSIMTMSLTSASTSTLSTPSVVTTVPTLNGFSSISVNNSILYVDYHAMSYTNASLYCQQNFSGNLASSKIVLSIGTVLGNYLSSNVTYWLQGKTQGQCQILYNDRGSSVWNTSSSQCDAFLPFICKGSNVTSPTSQSSTLIPTTTITPTSVAFSTTSSVSMVTTSLATVQGNNGWVSVGDIEYSLSNQKCSFATAGQCCKAAGATLSTTMDSATLQKISRILPTSALDGILWINGTSCILDHMSSYCDVLRTDFGMPRYDRSHVRATHLCLCQRPVVTHARLFCKEFYQTWERVGTMEYWKSGKPKSYQKAEYQCRRFGGTLVDNNKVSDPHFLDVLQLKNTDGAFWINQGNVTSGCAALSSKGKQITMTTASCFRYLYSICERPTSSTSPPVTVASRPLQTSTSNSTDITPKPHWTRHRRHEYYVTNDSVAYTDAETRCLDKFGSSLMFFTLATVYFEMATTLGLEAGKYWVGAGIEPGANDACLVLNVQDGNSSSLYSTDCVRQHRIVCRRPVKNDAVTFEPEFLQMLEEMAESGKSTKRERRKRASAMDYRISSKAMGLVGLSVVLLVSLIIVGFDVSNMKGCPKRRRRTMSSSTA